MDNPGGPNSRLICVWLHVFAPRTVLRPSSRNKTARLRERPSVLTTCCSRPHPTVFRAFFESPRGRERERALMVFRAADMAPVTITNWFGLV
jgi:hypothetical protein